MASFVKDILSIGVSKILIISCGLLSSVIVARTLGPEKNGIIAALLVYPAMFMTVGSLGIRQATTYYLGKKLFSEDEIKTAITQIWLLSSFVCLVVCFFLMTELSRSGNNLLWVLLALTPIPFSLFNTYNSGVFLGKNQIQMFTKINWIPASIILLLVVGFLYIYPMGISGYLLAMIGGPLFMFVVLLFKNKFIQAFSFRFNWVIIKKMLGLGMIYALALLLISLNTRLDIILLDRLSTPFETGIYSKGATITQYLWQIPMLLSTVIFARSATAKNERAFSLKVTQLLRLSFVFVGLAVIILLIFSNYLIVGMYGSDFEESVMILRLLLFGVLLLTIFKSLNQDLAGKGKPWVSMKAMIPALIINIGLNIYLIPDFGAKGAAFASTISYSFAALIFLHFYSREVSIPIKEILNFQKKDFAPILKLINRV